MNRLRLLGAGWFSGWALLLLALLVTPRALSASAEPAPKRSKPSNPPKSWVTFEKCTYLEDRSNDADSFKVRCGKKDLHVRLYFVDAPESNLTDPERVLEQSRHFGITTNLTVQAGNQAAEVTRATLRRPFTVHTRWTVAGGRSRQPRYYAIVEAGSQDLASLLVEQGWARAKGAVAPTPAGEPSKSVTARLRRLEAEARQRRLGAWGMAPRPTSP